MSSNTIIKNVTDTKFCKNITASEIIDKIDPDTLICEECGRSIDKKFLDTDPWGTVLCRNINECEEYKDRQ